MRLFCSLAGILLILAGPIWADTVLFKNGRVMRNVRATLGKKRLRVKTKSKRIIYYPTSSVKRVIIKPVNWKKKTPVPVKKEPVKVKKIPESKKVVTPPVHKSWLERKAAYFPVFGLHRQKRHWLASGYNVLEFIFLLASINWSSHGPSNADDSLLLYLVIPNNGLPLPQAPAWFSLLVYSTAYSEVKSPSDPDKTISRSEWREGRNLRYGTLAILLLADFLTAKLLHPGDSPAVSLARRRDQPFAFHAGYNPLVEKVNFSFDLKVDFR